MHLVQHIGLGFIASIACFAVAQPTGTVSEPHDSTAAPTTLPTTQPAKRAMLRYKLVDGNESWPADKRDAIVKAMDEALAIYNDVGSFDKLITVSYNPGTPTADANFNGHIRFGGQIGTRTALHEIGHTLGCGTTRQWQEHLVDGKWTGPAAIAQLKAFDGPDAVLKGDRQHFWPYGLNYQNEWSDENARRHVMMVAAFRKDMGFDNNE